MADSRGVEWTVYRRFSDFAPFDAHVRRMLPHLETRLPPKELLRPLAGFLGIKAPSPTADFLDERRSALDDYVKAILTAAGGNRTAFWNHPVVLTFFDIPMVVQSRTSPASDRSCPVPARDWSREMDRTQALVDEAVITLERAESTAARGHDTANHQKHLRRQLGTIRRSLDKLQTSLDYFARIDRLPDERLQEMSQAFQRLAGSVEALERRMGAGRPDGSLAAVAVANHTPPSSSEEERAHFGRPTVPPPIARTPVRSHLSSSSFGSRPLPRNLPSTPPRPSVASMERQDAIIRQQDAQISELSSIIQRQKDLGHALTQELGSSVGMAGGTVGCGTDCLWGIDEQNQMLDNLATGVGGAQTKINTANRRVKKL